MKTLKRYGLVAVAGLIMACAGVGCKKQPQPVGKIVGGRVVGWYKTNEVPGAQISIIDLEGESLELYNRDMFSQQVDASLPTYDVGDSVWFRYEDVTKKYGEIFADQVIDTAVYGNVDFYRQQQREIYGKNK